MKLFTLAALAVATMALSAVAQAAESTTATQSAATTATAAKAKDTTASADAAAASIKEVGNKLCPISGQPVGSMQKGSHVDYNGYRVGLCCDGCKKGFMKDADANLAKAQAEAGKK